MGEEGESGLGPAICAPGGAGALVQGAAAAFFAPGASTTLPPAIPRPSMGPRLARAAQEPLRDASVKPAGVMRQACARDSRSTRSNRPKDRGSRGRCARGSRCWQEPGSTGVGSASRGWHAPLCSARLSKIDSVLVSCFSRASTTADRTQRAHQRSSHSPQQEACPTSEARRSGSAGALRTSTGTTRYNGCSSTYNTRRRDACGNTSCSFLTNTLLPLPPQVQPQQ